MSEFSSRLRDIVRAYDALAVAQGLLHTAKECMNSRAFEGAERRAVEIAATAAVIVVRVSDDLLEAVRPDDDEKRSVYAERDLMIAGDESSGDSSSVEVRIGVDTLAQVAEVSKVLEAALKQHNASRKAGA